MLVGIQKQITQDNLSHALENRPAERELEITGVLKTKRGSMSDVLAQTAVQLEREIKADIVSTTINKRSSDLGSHGAPLSKRSSLSNVLAATAKELEVRGLRLSSEKGKCGMC